MTAYVISNLLTMIASFGLGLLVFQKSRDRPAARMWSYLCFGVAVWTLGEALTVSSTTAARAEFAGMYLMHGGGIFIPAFFVHFTVLYTGLRARRYLVAMYAAVIGLMLLNISGKMCTYQPVPPFRFYFVALPLYSLFVLHFTFFMAAGEIILLRAWWKAEGMERQHLKFLLVSTFTGFLCGATTLLPAIHVVFPIGMWPLTIYVVVTTYAIYRYRLMDISIVIRKTLIYSTVSTALIVMYVAVIFVLTRVFEGLFESPYVPSAMAAGVIAILFEPLRRRIQDWADRLFPRESMNQRLLKEATGTFVHEIKSPLAAISVPAELALMDLEEAKQKGTFDPVLLKAVSQRVEYILKQSEEAGAKMDALQKLIMLEPRPMEIVNMADVITQALSSQKRLLDRTQVHVTLDLMPLSVWGTPKLLEIAFSNIVKNALEAFSPVGDGRPRELMIRMGEAGNQVRTEICDSGLGLPKEQGALIFKPYFTLKGTSGMGLGLCITQEIITQHGGRIEAENAETGGARFSIWLPRLVNNVLAPA